jgi:hypothetical protein
MKLNVTVDTTGFAGMIRDLSRLSGSDFDHVLREQTIAVLQRAASWTPIAKVSNLEKAASRAGNSVRRLYEKSGRKIANTPKRKWFFKGDKWYIMEGKGEWEGGRTAQNGGRWSNSRYAEYLSLEQDQEKTAKSMERDRLRGLKAARGLTRRSWVDIANDLGFGLKVSPTSVSSARPSDGSMHKNGYAIVKKTAKSLIIEIANTYPALVFRLDGNAILQRAIKARITAFNMDLKKNVFNNIELRAKRYPGIFVR